MQYDSCGFSGARFDEATELRCQTDSDATGAVLVNPLAPTQTTLLPRHYLLHGCLIISSIYKAWVSYASKPNSLPST